MDNQSNLPLGDLNKIIYGHCMVTENTSVTLERVKHADFCYWWLVSMVNHSNHYSYANTCVDAMVTQLKPSFGNQLCKIDHCMVSGPHRVY